MDHSQSKKVEMSVEMTITALQLNAGSAGHILLKNFNTYVDSGQLIALIGLNGSGKSTLLNTLSGLSKPSGGVVLIEKKDIHAVTANDRSKLVSIVFTSQESIAWMDTESFIAMGRSPHTSMTGKLKEKDQLKINETIDATGLSPLRNRFFHTLSDGERQRCLIARALVQDTPIILLDEPTAFLDVRNKKQIMVLLKQLTTHEKKCILFSTHDINHAKQYADVIWWIDGQELKVIAPTDFNEEDLH
jgi:iron complex transport system ATP-binding protein